MIVVRADDNQLNHPHAFVTSQKVVDFFQGAYGIDVSQLGSQLESYCLSGVEGMSRPSYIEYCLLMSTRPSHEPARLAYQALDTNSQSHQG